MKERLANLLSVKSLITLALTAMVCILTYRGDFDIRDIYVTIIAFFFGTQAQKNADAATVVTTETAAAVAETELLNGELKNEKEGE